MAKKREKILLWLLIIFVGFPILLVILGTFLTTTVSNEEGEAQQSQAITCETASQEDIENISSGMSDESYSVTSGFASTLPKSEI
jgi:uncharacterized membrane protein